MRSNEFPIVKCSHCKKILSSEDFDAHKWEIALIGTKSIPVADFLDTSCNGRSFISDWGIDGILYTFEVVPREALPYTMPLSDDGYPEPQNRRKVTRTL